MNQNIHYLIRDPKNAFGLIYPQESNLDLYQGFGSFYMVGSQDDQLLENYNFLAIQDDQIIETVAHQFPDNRNFYSINVESIGNFIFYAERLSINYPYTGSVQSLQNFYALRRFRSWKPQSLDNACRQYGFYFVGLGTKND